MAALLGEYVVDKDYRRVKIIIAFHPKERKFEVVNPAIRKDKSWIADISKVLSPDVKVLEKNRGSTYLFEIIKWTKRIFLLENMNSDNGCTSSMIR